MPLFTYQSGTGIEYISLARVNQHPPVHQLAVLSIGWAAFPHPVPNPVLTQDCTTVNVFGLLTFDPSYFLVFFLPNSDHTTLQPNHPSSLDTVLT
jgi:hypothetical protein